MPLDEPLPAKYVTHNDSPAVSKLREIGARLKAFNEPPLSFDQTACVLPALERLQEAEDLLRESKIHLNPASPLADRVAAYFARIES